MKKFELDRIAYYYAKKLLSSYIEDLKRNIENAEGAERIKLSVERNRVQEEFEEISARYDKLTNKEQYMRVYMYGMKDKARDDNNFYHIDYVRDLFLDEMTCDLRDEYFNVLCYRKCLGDVILEMYGYEFIGIKDIEDEQATEKEIVREDKV